MSEPTTDTPPVAVTPTPTKPGWHTSEFYMAWFAKIMGALVTSGILGDGTQASRIAGLIVIILAQAGYTYSRTAIKTAAMVFALLIMSNGTIACGPSARQQAVSGTLIAANAAAQGFEAFDAKMQASIVAGATDRKSGEATLAEWRKKRTDGLAVLVGLYRAIAIAATLDDGASVQSMLSALAIAKQQLAAMGVTL